MSGRTIVGAGRYQIGHKNKGGREFVGTVFCPSRKAAKREALKLFGKNGIATPAR
jgi:hypothetical protein